MSEATAERGEATTFCTVPEAIAAIARGEVVVVVDASPLPVVGEERRR